MRMRQTAIGAIVFGPLLGGPSARAHILAIAGAVGFDDQPFINLVQQLAASERAIYNSERPPGCTNFYVSPTTGENVMSGPGYTILLAPTGDFAMLPDWNLARTRLETEIAAFQTYLQGVDLPCECREYLHIIGFSDGASTIGGWLNLGAANTQPGDDFYGVVSLIDVVRQFDTMSTNTNVAATWLVSAMPPDRMVVEYTAFRNRSGGLLEGCSIVENNWTGHIITTTPVPWSNGALLDNNTCHTDFPDTTLVKGSLLNSVDVATLSLINLDLSLGKCNCISLNACPDLDGDGDVDLDDLDIFYENLSGPSAAFGPIPGDFDLDGDVDLEDFQSFQRAFSGS